jgi:hypothetical protein
MWSLCRCTAKAPSVVSLEGWLASKLHVHSNFTVACIFSGQRHSLALTDENWEASLGSGFLKIFTVSNNGLRELSLVCVTAFGRRHY